MSFCPVEPRRRARAVFVSDLHLGYRHARASAFLAFLRHLDTDRLYLVGDIVDGLRLRRTWRWGDSYHEIFDRLLEMARAGTRIHYAPGNHDAFVHRLSWWPDAVEVAGEFVHVGLDGRRLLVTHGDRFCRYEREPNRVVARSLELGYDFLLAANPILTASAVPPSSSLGSRVRRRLQRSTGYIEAFEQAAAGHAMERGFDGVVCGHVHAPDLKRVDDVIYANSGDWIEHSTAVVEDDNGGFAVLDLDHPRSVPLLRLMASTT